MLPQRRATCCKSRRRRWRHADECCTAAFSTSNRCAPPPASPVFCSDTRDAMAHSTFRAVALDCTRARRYQMQCSHSQSAVCNRPHRWKELAKCRWRSLRSELEVFYTQNELKVLPVAPQTNKKLGSGLHSPPDQQLSQRCTPELTKRIVSNCASNCARATSCNPT